MKLIDSLSDEQKELLNKNGKIVLRACPGSGKTYTVSAKLADLISSWDSNIGGIATLSFTNVAWKEIDKNLTENEIYIKHPHFLGTIDSFINRFIFLPFGHLVLNCKNRPQLVGEPHSTWSDNTGRGHNFYRPHFDKFSFDINGGIKKFGFIQNPFKNSGYADWNNFSKDNALKMKNELLEKGYATQNDSNYFAMKILEENEFIAKSLVKRFPYIIVDEAQDTSDVQMRIIDILIDNGLENIILVGDHDQAIYEWNNAKPELFNQKYEDWSENSFILNVNRRSSQTICNHTYNLSSLESVSAVSSTELSEIRPIIEVCDPNCNNSLNQTIDLFIDKCNEYNIDVNSNDVAILTRSKSLIDIIKGISNTTIFIDIWNLNDSFSKDIIKGKYLIDNADFQKGFKTIKHAFIKKTLGIKTITKNNLKTFLDEKNLTLLELRIKIKNIVDKLPNTNNQKVTDFIRLANSSINNLNLASKNNDFKIEQLFKIEKSTYKNCNIGTIHSVKGETYNAVLLFLRKSSASGKHYKTMINNNISNLSEEELRNVYVAITRPKQLLMIAVPDEDNKIAWNKKLRIYNEII